MDLPVWSTAIQVHTQMSGSRWDRVSLKGVSDTFETQRVNDLVRFPPNSEAGQILRVEHPGSVVVLFDDSGLCILVPDGSMLEIDYATRSVRRVTGSEMLGSLRYAGTRATFFAELVPERPPEAVVCVTCKGSGLLPFPPPEGPHTIGCGTCYHLGWWLPGEQPGAVIEFFAGEE